MNKLNQNVCIPKDTNYILQVVDESFGPSKSSDNPMITLECQVKSPETVTINGEEFLLAGHKVMHYLVTKVLVDGEVDVEKTKGKAAQLEKAYNAFKIPFDNATFNPDNPELGFKGKCFHALLYGKQDDQTKAPTSEQIKAGKKVGDVLKNPITGEPLKKYQVQLGEIFGLATTDAGKPY